MPRATFRALSRRSAIRSITIIALVSLGLIGGLVSAGVTPEHSRGPEASNTGSARIVVFAASSLTDVMPDLTEAFGRVHPDLHVDVSYAASSRLALQIREGMPGDVFVSAGRAPMTRAEESGRIATSSVTVVATNRLVLIAPPDNPAGIRQFSDIGTKPMELTVPAPGVPAREYTDEVVRNMSAPGNYGEAFREQYHRNIASEENNVRQAAARVALGEADAGVVYATDVTPEIHDRVLAFPVPSSYGVTAEYVVGTVRDSHSMDTARAFRDFLLSDHAAAILAEHGFTSVEAINSKERL